MPKVTFSSPSSFLVEFECKCGGPRMCEIVCEEEVWGTLCCLVCGACYEVQVPQIKTLVKIIRDVEPESLIDDDDI